MPDVKGLNIEMGLKTEVGLSPLRPSLYDTIRYIYVRSKADKMASLV